MPYKTFSTPVSPQWPDYGCNIYKDGDLVEGRIYKNYSGYAMADEVKDLKMFAYKPAEGYSIEW
tara:strand:+ start:1297 stop:1488 length:192 start_codon:yes stop_codon:yes gene_type:complete